MNKSLLLISYTFPPYPGIGGRRWAKFVKYLVRLGYKVHVITAANPFNNNSLWVNDVSGNENIILHRLPSLYPKVLLQRPTGIVEKIAYHFWVFILRVFSKGTIYDRGIFWKKKMMAEACGLIRKYSIKNVIVSGAPFRTAYYAIGLKEKFPHINIISDLRDPWTWGSGYGYSVLSPARKAFEAKMEAKVIEKSDIITVPVTIMADHLKSTYSSFANKISVLPHAFDEDEALPLSKEPNDKIRMIYYGNLYDGIGEYVTELCNALKKCPDNFTIDIYSESRRYSDNFAKAGLDKIVKYHDPIPSKFLFNKMASYNYVLMIYPDYARNFHSTKFYEVINMRTPIIYIGKEGLNTQFIEQNRLGLTILPEKIEKEMKALLEARSSINYNFDFDVSIYSFQKVTAKLIGYFV